MAFIPALIAAGATIYAASKTGKKEKTKQLPTQTKEQKELARLINSGLIKGEGPFKDLFGKFNEQDFQEGVANPAFKQFKEQTLPTIQEKFIAGNQALGSAMRRGQLKAGTDFQENLAKLLYEAKQGHKQNQLAGLNAVLGHGGVENVIKGGSPSA